MAKRKDFQELTGKTFGRLTVISYFGLRNGASAWRCRCECGNSNLLIAGGSLRSGRSKSCGCLRREVLAKANVKHGAASRGKQSEEYIVLRGIMQRCHGVNPNPDYGPRGIYVCDAWRFGEDGLSAYECFIRDMGKRPTPAHTVERKDNDGPYSPANCVWATRKEQAKNTRRNIRVSWNGNRMILKEAFLLAGIHHTDYYAIKRKYRLTDQGAFDIAVTMAAARKRYRAAREADEAFRRATPPHLRPLVCQPAPARQYRSRSRPLCTVSNNVR